MITPNLLFLECVFLIFQVLLRQKLGRITRRPDPKTVVLQIYTTLEKWRKQSKSINFLKALGL
jgi:hypothetical protein